MGEGEDSCRVSRARANQIRSSQSHAMEMERERERDWADARASPETAGG